MTMRTDLLGGHAQLGRDELFDVSYFPFRVQSHGHYGTGVGLDEY